MCKLEKFASFTNLGNYVSVLPQDRTTIKNFNFKVISNLISQVNNVDFSLLHGFLNLYRVLKANTQYSSMIVLPTHTADINDIDFIQR